MRFASDEQGRNYYEYRAPLPHSPGGRVQRTDWQEVGLRLTDLSRRMLIRPPSETGPI